MTHLGQPSHWSTFIDTQSLQVTKRTMATLGHSFAKTCALWIHTPMEFGATPWIRRFSSAGSIVETGCAAGVSRGLMEKSHGSYAQNWASKINLYSNLYGPFGKLESNSKQKPHDATSRNMPTCVIGSNLHLKTGKKPLFCSEHPITAEIYNTSTATKKHQNHNNNNKKNTAHTQFFFTTSHIRIKIKVIHFHSTRIT